MAIEFTEGRYNKALKLNGQNLKLPLSSSEYTVIVNRRKENEALWEQVIKTSDGDIYDDYVLSFDKSDNINFSTLDISALTNCTITFELKTTETYWLPFSSDGTAHYIMASNSTKDFYHDDTTGGSITIYEDGVEALRPKNDGYWHSYTATNVDLSSWSGFYFNNYGNSDWQFDSCLKNITIYNRALTQQEIQDTMNKTLTGSEDGLVAYYPLSEGTGSVAYDKTLNGNNGVINGATWERKSDYALYFDGTNTTDYIEIPPAVFDGLGDFTYETEFTLKGVQEWGLLSLAHSSDNNELIIGTNSGEFAIYRHGTSRLSGVTAETNRLYSLALARTGDTFDLYLDGQQVHTTTFDNNTLIVEGVVIGQEQDTVLGGYVAGQSLHGSVLCSKVWNTARTQTEIQNNMYTELTGDETGLVAYYKMNEGMGDTLKDHAGNNDGTIYGASWDLSWLGTDSNGDLEINHTAEVVDEAVVIPRVVDTANLEEWNTIHRPFYDNISKSNLAMPTSVIMKEI